MLVLTPTATYFFGFAAVGLLAAVDLVFGFLCSAVHLVVTLGCVGASFTG
jgi:hypothetical protein